MSAPVTVVIGNLPEGWCPSSPQDMVNELNLITTATISGTGQPVRIMYGNFLPGFCNPTPQEFIDELNKVASGFVMDTGETVHVEFSLAGDFCWQVPQTVVDGLRSSVRAWVED